MLTGPQRERVAVVVVTVTNNAGGGQPVSMENLQEASRICRSHGVPLVLDAARFAENAWLVTQRETAYQRHTPRELAQAAFNLADGCLASLKKDGIANMGGLPRGQRRRPGGPLPDEHDCHRRSLPRRVYTHTHLEYVAETVGAVAKRAESIPGCRIVESPPLLRHFTARLEPVGSPAGAGR